MKRAKSSYLNRINLNTNHYFPTNKPCSMNEIQTLLDVKSMNKYSQQLKENRYSKSKARLSQINLALKRKQGDKFFERRCRSSAKMWIPTKNFTKMKRLSLQGSSFPAKKEIVISKVAGRQASQSRMSISKKDGKSIAAKTHLASPKRIGIMDYKTQFFRTNINMRLMNNKECLTRCKKIDPKMGSSKVFNIIYCSLQDIWKDKKEYCNNLRNIRKDEIQRHSSKKIL
ncbi:unnamed protein product [Moneuplotes crassus]|uniref:Uncharacterized protein n=1 Tax=Euplotes crassus TaxID=5936 RepID=A0AAD1UJP0_EUPCR|nr:unnamed protein product [Moneuplotes crassus]